MEKSLEELMKSFEEAQGWAQQMVLDRQNQCMKAVGHDTFCQCLAEEVPMMFPTFLDYVFVQSQTKEEIEYDSLDQEIRQSIDKVYKVRDECVGRAFSN